MKYWDEESKKLLTEEERMAKLAAEKEAKERELAEKTGNMKMAEENDPEEEPMMGVEEAAETKIGRKRK